MATKLEKVGYGQLELNQVAFRRDGRIEAQCKLAENIAYIENGMLLAVNNMNRTVDYVKSGNVHPIALHYSSEHMYDERANALNDFKLEAGSYLPRLGYLSAGDKYSTNTVAYDNTKWTSEDAFWAVLGTKPLYAHVGTDGYHLVDETATDAIAMAVAATTMPDGQRAIKFVAL
jgi:hypothetical protein